MVISTGTNIDGVLAVNHDCIHALTQLAEKTIELIVINSDNNILKSPDSTAELKAFGENMDDIAFDVIRQRLVERN